MYAKNMSEDEALEWLEETLTEGAKPKSAKATAETKPAAKTAAARKPAASAAAKKPAAKKPAAAR
jgi:hypothetical protein